MRLQPAQIRYGDPAGLFCVSYVPIFGATGAQNHDIRHRPRTHPHRDRPPSARGRGLHRAPALPDAGTGRADPFLLLDEMGPVEYGPGEAVGRPITRTAASRTITYMLEASSSTRTRPGTAACSARARAVDDRRRGHRAFGDAFGQDSREGGRVHGFQIWVNLPAKLR